MTTFKRSGVATGGGRHRPRSFTLAKQEIRSLSRTSTSTRTPRPTPAHPHSTMKSHNGWFALPCRGFLAHPPARGQANAMLDQCLVEVGVDPRVNRLVADRMALGVRRIVHRSHCATCLHAQAPADLAGRAPLRQISKHAAAKNLVAVQEPLLGAAPGHLRRSPGVLGPIRPIRTAVAGDFKAHHRGTTPNQTSDTHLGQASLQPHHNRRTILNTQHPTTAHNQPLQQHCYHTNCLHPMTPPPHRCSKRVDSLVNVL